MCKHSYIQYKLRINLKSHPKIQCTYICHVQWTARQVNRGASTSPVNTYFSWNAPEGKMWNIRQGIVLSAGFAMTHIHNIQCRSKIIHLIIACTRVHTCIDVNSELLHCVCANIVKFCLESHALKDCLLETIANSYACKTCQSYHSPVFLGLLIWRQLVSMATYLELLPDIFAFPWLDWVNCKCVYSIRDSFRFLLQWSPEHFDVDRSRVALPHQVNSKVAFELFIAVIDCFHSELEQWFIIILLKFIVRVHPVTLSFRHGLIF